jgi:Protein of unknown function (DUF2798)
VVSKIIEIVIASGTWRVPIVWVVNMASIRDTVIMMILMTIMMGLSLSGVFTWQVMGFGQGFIATWLSRFANTYVIVLPTVLVVSPIARWLTVKISRSIDGSERQSRARD